MPVQVRVWDTRGGTVATWDQLILPQNNNVLRGYSDLFAVPFPLGDTQVPPGPAPCLQGLQSFNLFIIPEPTVLTLGCLSVVGAFVFADESAGSSARSAMSIETQPQNKRQAP